MNSIGIQLRISDLLFAVQKRWRIIVSLTFLGLVFGILLSGMNYVQSAVQNYEISGSFIINAVDSQGRYSSNGTAPNKNDMSLAADLYDTIYYLLQSDRLMYQIINDQQLLGVSASDIRSGLSLSQYNSTNIITMKLTWDNEEEGLQLWQAIIETANVLLPKIVQVGRLQVFNEPQPRLISSRSMNIKTWMVLPVLGLGAGMGFAIIETLMRPTLINVKDVENVLGLETIGIIPYDQGFFANRNSMLVADEKSSSEVMQNYSAAAYILRNRIGFKESCHCFYITSTTGQEGRTTAAANLAIQLSDMERRTLLIDFDYKNPTLGSLFLNNLNYSRSLNALYRSEINLYDAITTLTGYLDILPMVMEHNLVYLDSGIVDMIAQLRTQYQYIIIDAPPVGRESETLSLNQVANTVLFVARYDTASIPEIQATLEKLNKSGIRILGCIFNGVKSTKNVLFGSAKGEADKKKTPAEANKKKKKKKRSGTKKESAKEDESVNQLLTGKAKTPKKKNEKAKPASTPQADTGPVPAAPPEAPVKESDFYAGEIPMPNPQPRDEGKAPGTETKPAEQPIVSGEEVIDLEGADAPAPAEEPKEERMDIPRGEPFLAEPEVEPETLSLIPEPAPIQEPDSVGQAADEAGIITLEPIPASPDSGIDISPSDGPPKAPEKKRGLFGRKPSEPKQQEKTSKPGKKPKPPSADDSPKKAGAASGKNKKKKAKAETADKKKGSLFSFGKPKQKEAAPLEEAIPTATVIQTSRNVFEDLMGEGPVQPKGKTDEEMMEELLRMGLDGSWTQSSESSDGDKPKSGKRNIFDDL